MNCDVIVIGAGPAGAIASMKLRKNGLNVIVLEKFRFPRFVIGESLLPKCMDYLEDLDLIDLLDKQGYQIKTGATFFHKGDYCQFLFDDKHAEGWDTTWQVQREKFDHLLINEAEKRGVDVRFEVSVCRFENHDNHREVVYETKDGRQETLKARFVVDASGYGKVLPRLLGLLQEVPTQPRSAVYCRFKDPKRPDVISNNILQHSFDNNRSWSWVIPFADGTTSVGIVGDTDTFKEWIANDGELFYDNFKGPETFKDRFKDSELVMPFRHSTNYASSVTDLHGPGFVLCGNATEFLDPIFSSGVLLAISSGHKAAELVTKELNDEKIDWDEDYTKFLKQGLDVFRSFVNAWYEGTLDTIFYTKQPLNKKIKRQICSVLAGFVWDQSNPFATKHKSVIKTLAKVVKIQASV